MHDYKKLLVELRHQYTHRRDAIHVEKWHTEQAVEKDFAEQVVQRENEDVLNALDQETENLVLLIDNALLRIEDGSYGKCLECGMDIPEKRLLLVPYAEYCVDCAEAKEN